PAMWVKSRKVGSGKRQQWDDGPLAMHEREAQRCRRVQALLRERLTKYREAAGQADGRGSAGGEGRAMMRDDAMLIAVAIGPIIAGLLALAMVIRRSSSPQSSARG